MLSNDLTAGMLSRNFKQRVQEFIAKDKTFSFMSSIKGAPAYWKKFLHQVLAMVKQSGIPTFYGNVIRNTNIFLNIVMC